MFDSTLIVTAKRVRGGNERDFRVQRRHHQMLGETGLFGWSIRLSTGGGWLRGYFRYLAGSLRCWAR
jgi:hypothetical protein